VDLDTVLAILVATIAATVLRWGASRWPDASEKRSRARQERLDELEDRLRIRQLEQELGEDTEP
jgi:hypothetical protein